MITPENNDEIINLETTEITEPEPEVKVKEYKAPHRHRPDGSYDSRPNDPEYWKKYWHKTKAPSECPHCGTVYVHNDGLRKHLKVGKKCRRLRAAFPALAALALVAVQADLNVTRLLEQLHAESQAEANV